MVKMMQEETKPIFLVDYDWSVQDNDLVLDPHLRTASFGWKTGDYFQLRVVNGKKTLVKVESVEVFLDGVKVNGN